MANKNDDDVPPSLREPDGDVPPSLKDVGGGTSLGTPGAPLDDSMPPSLRTPSSETPGQAQSLAQRLFSGQNLIVDFARKAMSVAKMANPLSVISDIPGTIRETKWLQDAAKKPIAPLEKISNAAERYGGRVGGYIASDDAIEKGGERIATATNPLDKSIEVAKQVARITGRGVAETTGKFASTLLPKSSSDIAMFAAFPYLTKAATAVLPILGRPVGSLLRGADEAAALLSRDIPKNLAETPRLAAGVERTAGADALKPPKLDVIDPATTTHKGPYALYQGNFDFGPGNSYSTYRVYGEHPRTGGNFGSADLEQMGIPIIGREARVPADVEPIGLNMGQAKALPEGPDPVKTVSDRIARKFKGEGKSYGLSELYQDTINRFHSIEKMGEMASEGGTLKPGEDPRLLARSYLGMVGKANTFLEHQTFKMTPEGNIEFTGPGLKQVIEPMTGKLEDLSTYLVARRSLNLANRNIETGVPLEAAQKSVAALEAKHPELAQVAEGIQKWNDSLLNYLVDSGRIGKSNFEAMKAANDFYVPMNRAIEDLPGVASLKNNEIFNRVINPVKKIKGSAEKIIDPMESMIRNSFAIIDAADRNKVAQSVLNLRSKSPDLRDLIQVAKEPGKDTITAYYAGHPVHYKVPDIVLKAMRGLSEEQSGMITKILGFPTRLLRAGATLSPEFALRNPVRDQWSAMINSKYGFRPYYDAARGAFSMLGGGDDAYWRWQASGGAQSFLVSMDRTLSDMLWAPPKNYWNTFGSYVKNPLKILQDVSGGLEEPTRIGLFKRAKDKAASDIEAGFESREGTVDFARRGAKMRALNSIYAFFNARLQGVDKTIRAFKENPAKASMAAAPLTTASVLLHLINRGDPEFQEMPQWKKDLFWMFKVKDKWVQIPKGDVGVLFGSGIEHVMDWMEGEDPGKMAAFALDTLNNISPVDFSQGGMLPNFAKPIMENLANYNYFLKRSIVSEGKQQLLPEYQFNDFDTETSKAAGKLLGVSPSKVSNLIFGYTGGLGRHVMKLMDKAGEAAGAFEPKPELPTGPEDVPGIKGFFAKSPQGSSSQSVNDFYSKMETIAQARNTIKKNPGDMNKIDAEYPEWRLAGTFEKTSDALGKFREIRNKIMQAKNLTPEQRQENVEKINAQMTMLARTAMDQYHALKRPGAKKKQVAVDDDVPPSLRNN